MSTIYIMKKDALVLIIQKEDFKDFKHLVARGCNTWDEAPAWIKELHDYIIHGEILQNYKAQNSSPKELS